METKEKTAQEVYTRMAALCSRAEQFSPDIRKKIIAAGLTDEEAGDIIEKLKAEKFIDDQRYANFYVAEKFRINKWGRIKIWY